MQPRPEPFDHTDHRPAENSGEHADAAEADKLRNVRPRRSRRGQKALTAEQQMLDDSRGNRCDDRSAENSPRGRAEDLFDSEDYAGDRSAKNRRDSGRGSDGNHSANDLAR